jgi:hypothetical protein
MKTFSSKFIHFFKSKSVIDFVYLIMMILIVTMIKDMMMSLYRKRKDKQWLDKAFSKGKGKNKKGDSKKKNVEGFTDTDCGNTSTGTICDKLKFILCNNNFNKFIQLMNAITVDGTDKLNINTNGGFISTGGGAINTYGGNINIKDSSENKHGDFHCGIINADGIIYAYGGIDTNNGNIRTRGDINADGIIHAHGGINTGGGGINTSGGAINTYGGNINIKASSGNKDGDFHCGEINADGSIHANGGIKTNTIVIPKIHSESNSARVLRFKSEDDGNDKNSLDIAYIPFITENSKKWQIRQTHSFFKEAPNAIYENKTETGWQSNADKWGLKSNGDDLNDHNSTHWYFAKTDEGVNLAG